MAHFSSTKIKGSDIHVIFNGSHYFFQSNFYGLIAYATRDTGNDCFFHCFVGNRHTFGGHLCESNVYAAIKKYIKKEETQFIAEKVISFDCISTDLADKNLNISLL